MFDGDTVFALATGRDPLPTSAARYRAAETRPGRLNQLLDAAARCFAAAVTDAVISAPIRRRSARVPRRCVPALSEIDPDLASLRHVTS